MNLDSLNKWLTLLANFGVLIGLTVVIFEIRQNTTAIENDSYWNRVSVAVDLRAPLMESEQPVPEMNPDALQVTLHLSNVLNQTEARYFTQPMNRDELGINLIPMLTPRGSREYIQRRIQQHNPEFKEFVQELIREIESGE